MDYRLCAGVAVAPYKAVKNFRAYLPLAVHF